ncbi:hypothetical protein P5G63_17555 [Aeromonas salmonicida]|uniref:hypothetical protein n=1 Tax=Aeromonas salmonicida TaxID=645 RepID=UPI00223EF21E|nr:hypothetical protein [Aeromonas salmonicida]MDF8330184.1 hypothetical protein [Aeromonas salmonicida]
MLPSAIYEPLPFAYMGSGLLLLGVAEQPGLLLAGLAFYLAGSLAWFRRSAHRRIDKLLPARTQGWPLWLYEIRPFALILLGLLMLRLATHPIFLAPALVWCLLGGYQLLQRHYSRIVLARVLA